MTEPRPAPLASYRPQVPKIVQFAADGLAADVRVQRVDRRGRAHVYAIRLASAEADAFGRLVGTLPSGEIVELGDVAVGRGSIGSARLTVITPRGGYDGVYLEIRSERVLLRVEAPNPSRRRRVHPLVAGGALVAFGTLSLAAGSLAFAVPQTPLVQAAGNATAGSAVQVSYAARGLGSASYAARYDDGAVIASGTLPSTAGEIALPLPAGAANRRVSVAVSLRGPLGDAAGMTTFAVAPPPRVAGVPARVISLAARRDPAASGETVLASYLAVGDGGNVVVQDGRGRIIATAPFAHVGTTRLTVGNEYRDQPLTARLSVERGSSRAVASVALPAAGAPAQPSPAAANPAPPDPDVPEGVTPLEPARAGATVGMLALEGRAVAGATLRLRVMAHRAPMTVELQNASGETLAEQEIAAGATRAAIALPAEGGTYFLVLHYQRDGGEETVVRSLRVASPGASISAR